MTKTAQKWVQERLAQSGVNTFIADLTPDLATYLLEVNQDNRKLRQSVVDAYARDMASGSWALNGEPIIISSNGQLNDGQHRCWAVVTSGATIKTAFVFGVERSTMTTVDQGIARRLSDHLQVEGVVSSHSSRVATLAAMVWRFNQTGHTSAASGQSGRASSKATKAEMIALLESDPTITHAVHHCVAESKTMRMVAPASAFQFIFWLLTKTNPPHEVNAFIERIVKGHGLEMGAPELYVRSRLMVEKGRLRPNEVTELLVRAWNAHVRGERIKSFPINGGKLPEIKRIKQ